jgi:hypothetical protein
MKIEVMIECFPTLGSTYVTSGPIISVLFDDVLPLKKNLVIVRVNPTHTRIV